jgi:hypothetical protein
MMIGSLSSLSVMVPISCSNALSSGAAPETAKATVYRSSKTGKETNNEWIIRAAWSYRAELVNTLTSTEPPVPPPEGAL